MNKTETGLPLDDFESDARLHIGEIESAFLDAKALADAPALMDGVFRHAHSLKGTAGFFSLKEIVSVSHGLESVYWIWGAVTANGSFFSTKKAAM